MLFGIFQIMKTAVVIFDKYNSEFRLFHSHWLVCEHVCVCLYNLRTFSPRAEENIPLCSIHFLDSYKVDNASYFNVLQGN